MFRALFTGVAKLLKFNFSFYLLLVFFAPIVDVLARLASELYKAILTHM